MNTMNRKLAIEAMKEYFGEDAGVTLQTFEKPLLIGYFDDYDKVDDALKRKEIQKIYAPVHEVSEECINRLSCNKLTPLKKGMGVSAKDMERYTTFFIDIDAKCVHIEGEKQNATEQQHQDALALGEEVRDYLEEIGWGKPYFVDSGNGCHLLYYLSLDATKENSNLIKKALCALSEKFSCEKGSIDTVTYDISRKIKLPGSSNNEGQDHRVAKILSIPAKDEMAELTTKDLEKLAGSWSGKRVPKISKGDDNKPTMDDVIELLENVGDYYLDMRDTVYVDIPYKETAITYPVESPQFKLFIRGELKTQLGIKTVKNDFWQQIYGYLDWLAHESGRREDIRNRITRRDGAIYYDLQSEDYIMIMMDKENIFECSVEPGYFYRNDSDLPQSYPDFNMNRYDLVNLVMELFNFTKKQDAELFAVWLASCFFPDSEHPILWMTGAQGTAKSTACSIIQQIVSPQTIERSSFPKKTEDLVLILTKRVLTVFDNVGYISDEASNILCQAVTGGNYSKRKLYTDTDMVTIPLRSIVVMNSCDSVINKPDLLSRVLQFNLARIDKEKILPDFCVKEKIAEKIPKVLGAVFDCVQAVLASTEEIPQISYVIRLAEFQLLASKIGIALGMDPEYVTSLLEMNKKDIDTHILESHPVAYLIEKFMENTEEWVGSVQELYTELCNLACDFEVDKRDKLFPKSPSALSAKLNSLQSMLERAGIVFHIKNVRTHKEITVTNMRYSNSADKISEDNEPEYEDDEIEFDDED